MHHQSVRRYKLHCQSWFVCTLWTIEIPYRVPRPCSAPSKLVFAMWPRGERSQMSRSEVTLIGLKVVKVKVGFQRKAGGLTTTSSCFIFYIWRTLIGNLNLKTCKMSIPLTQARVNWSFVTLFRRQSQKKPAQKRNLPISFYFLFPPNSQYLWN